MSTFNNNNNNNIQIGGGGGDEDSSLREFDDLVLARLDDEVAQLCVNFTKNIQKANNGGTELPSMKEVAWPNVNTQLDNALVQYTTGVYRLQEYFAFLVDDPEGSKRALSAAKQRFEFSRQEDEHFIYATYGLGLVSLISKEYARAYRHLSEVLCKLGRHAPNLVRFAIGVCALHLDRVDIALKCFARVRQLDPNDSLGYIGTFLAHVKGRNLVGIAESLGALSQLWEDRNISSNGEISTPVEVTQKQLDMFFIGALQEAQQQAKSSSSSSATSAASSSSTSSTDFTFEQQNQIRTYMKETVFESMRQMIHEIRTNKSSASQLTPELLAYADFQEGRLLLACGMYVDEARLLLQSASEKVLPAIPHLVLATLQTQGKQQALGCALEGMNRLVNVVGIAPYRELCEMTTLLLQLNGQIDTAVRTAKYLVDTVGLAQPDSWYNSAFVNRLDEKISKAHALQGKSIQEATTTSSSPVIDSQIAANIVCLEAAVSNFKQLQLKQQTTSSPESEGEEEEDDDDDDDEEEKKEGEEEKEQEENNNNNKKKEKNKKNNNQNPDDLVAAVNVNPAEIFKNKNQQLLSEMEECAKKEMNFDLAALLASLSSNNDNNNTRKQKQQQQELELRHIPIVFNYALQHEVMEEKEGKTSQAVQLYCLLVKKFPHEPAPYFRLASISLSSGDHQSCLSWMQLCVSLTSKPQGKAECFSMMAKTLASTGMKGNATAYKFLTGAHGKAVLAESSPQAQSVIYACAGACLAHDAQGGQHIQMKAGAALRLFKQALRLDSQSVVATHGIACCVALLGSSEHASSLLEKIVGERCPDDGSIVLQANDNLFNAYVNTAAHRQALRLESQRPVSSKARDRLNAITCSLLLTGEYRRAAKKAVALVKKNQKHPLSNFTGVLVAVAEVLSSVADDSRTPRSKKRAAQLKERLASCSQWAPVATQIRDHPDSIQFVHRLLAYIRKLQLEKIVDKFVDRSKEEKKKTKGWQEEWREEQERLMRQTLAQAEEKRREEERVLREKELKEALMGNALDLDIQRTKVLRGVEGAVWMGPDFDYGNFSDNNNINNNNNEDGEEQNPDIDYEVEGGGGGGFYNNNEVPRPRPQNNNQSQNQNQQQQRQQQQQQQQHEETGLEGFDVDSHREAGKRRHRERRLANTEQQQDEEQQDERQDEQEEDGDFSQNVRGGDLDERKDKS